MRFYLPSTEEIVTDESQLKEAKQGPDWRCGHCGASNKASVKACTSCGNPRDEASEDENYSVRSIRPGQVENAGQKRPISVSQPSPRKSLLRVVGAILAGIIILIITAVSCRRVEYYPVEGHRWERKVEMEQYTWVTHEEWDLPPDAELITSFQDIHHYDQVYVRTETRTRDVQVKVGEQEYICGQKDLGNGYFEDEYCTESIYETQTETYQEDIYESVPVYQTKYRYRIQQWIYDHTIEASGKNQQPEWPSEQHPGNESTWREGFRHERYWLLILDAEGKRHEEEVPLGYWHATKPAMTVPVITYFGIWSGLDKQKAGIQE